MLELNLFLLAIYSFFQIRHYLKRQYIKEIIIFSVLLAISVFYLIDYQLDLNAVNPSKLLTFLYKPLAELLFSRSLET